MMQRHLPMGYKMVNGQIVINEENVGIIIRIFEDYVSGNSLKVIAAEMTASGVLTPNKKAIWNHGTVGKILNNVKYQGDGLYPKIINSEVFKIAQERRGSVERTLGRTLQVNAIRNQTAFSGKIRCGECGEVYRKYVEHAGKPSEKSKWKCKHYIYQNRVLCRNHFFTDEDLKDIFIEATNQLLKQRRLLNQVRQQEPPKMSLELRETENRIKELEQEGDYSNPELPRLIFKRAQLYYAGSKIYEHPSNMEKMNEALEGISELTEFDEELFETIIKQITIYRETGIQVEFINRIIIEKPIEIQRKDGNHGSSKKDGSNHTTTDEVRQKCQSRAQNAQGCSLL